MRIQLFNRSLWLLLSGLLLSMSCSKTESQLKPFESDGCSMFPDRSLIDEKDWCECCYQHDLAYWQGGTLEQREQADQALRDCILKKTQNQQLAEIMYFGVRYGGSPYFYSWYRWGYGWDYSRK
ncbi:MAG: hypothetical protein ACI81V_000216, partial [Lentimonas sp.]